MKCIRAHKMKKISIYSKSIEEVIKKAKTVFVEKALSSKRPKDVWKTIHLIQHIRNILNNIFCIFKMKGATCIPTLNRALTMHRNFTL